MTMKLREVKEAVISLLSKPYTSKFPAEAYIPPATFRGKPKFQSEGCVGCGACAEVCPANAVEVVENEKTRKLILHLDNCIFCATCETYCITQKGIKLSQEYDLATLDRHSAIETIEKELVRCELCDAVITTADHLDWVAKRAGAVAYSNPTLILTLQKELTAIEPPPDTLLKAQVKYQDQMRILCPECRRTQVLLDEWVG